MSKYRIIGSIYGKDCWKKLIQDDCVNIFTGNYFDPINDITATEAIDNFKNLINYNKKHHNCIFLIGNHDFHYIDKYEKYKGFNPKFANTYRNLLVSNNANKIAHSINDKVLITHAGVGKLWLNNICRVTDDVNMTPDSLSKYINDLYADDIDAFTFNACAALNDISGTSVDHSPLWLDSSHLQYINPFNKTNYLQIVGHTAVKSITKKNGIWNVGCLSKNISCLEYDSDNDKFNIIENMA